jgi:hypothetical protein
VAGEVKTSALLAKLQDNINIQRRSDIQGVGNRGNYIRKGERNKQMIIDTQQFYIVSIQLHVSTS